MKAEVKERIEKIKKGETPNNYKYTKMGIIPEDWDDTILGNRVRIFRGASPRPQGDPRYYGGSIPRVMIQDVTRDGKYTFPSIDSLTEEGAKKSRFMKKGDLVLSCSGTKVAIPGLLGIDACIHDGFFGFDQYKDVDKEYLYYFFEYFNLKMQSSATKGGVFNNLTTSIMKELPIGFPKLYEQQKISTIFSTWDKAIELKDELIKQKKEQKRGLMKKLLNRETRLLWFDDEWKRVELGKICEIKKGSQLNKIDMIDSKIYPVLNGGMIPSGYTDKWNTEKDTIAISEGGNSCGFINYVNERFWCGGHCYIVNPDSNLIKKLFLYQLLKYNEPLIMNLRVGSGLPNIQKKSLLGLILEIPSLVEQKFIGDILATFDKEINLIEQELLALKLQKKGLMQLLLTGIVRVKV